MTSRKLLVACLIAVGATILWYANSLTMTEYEHGLSLPNSSRLVESDVSWWIPCSMKNDTHSSSLVQMSKADFTSLVISLPNCRGCEPVECTPGSKYSLFPVQHGDVTHLEVKSMTSNGTLLFKLITVYA
jgi:hypothetical protein